MLERLRTRFALASQPHAATTTSEPRAAEPDAGPDIEEIAELALEQARSAGADEASVAVNKHRHRSFRVRAGSLDGTEESYRQNLTAELFVAGRYFVQETNDFRPTSLAAFMRSAVQVARALQPDPARGLPPCELLGAFADISALDLVDPHVTNRSATDRLIAATSVDAALQATERLIYAQGTASDSTHTAVQATSNGFRGAWQRTQCQLEGEITLRDPSGTLHESSYSVDTTHLADQIAPERIAELAVRQAQMRFGARKGPTLRTTMVVDREVAGRLLHALLEPASGAAMYYGRSFWRNPAVKVAPLLGVADDPTRPRAVASRPFDGDGFPTTPRTLIENSALTSFYLDHYYATKLERPPTTGLRSNLVVTPGRGDVQSLARDAGNGLYVTSFLGGNIDSTRGMFSYGIGGHLIENGVVGRPVREMNITGNILDLFSRLVAVGGDALPYRSSQVPTLVFEGVDFSGTT